MGGFLARKSLICYTFHDDTSFHDILGRAKSIGCKKADGTIKKGVGNFVRDWSLDEFPQLFNVLKGDMSLAGTRPPTLDELNKYELCHRAPPAFKPGITGMWQVSGRSNITDFEEIAGLDKEYIKNWKSSLDIHILLKTVQVVFKKKKNQCKGVMNMPSVKIIIATHKKYRMPDDEMYVPVQVGAEGKDDLGYTRDNTGDNISSLNPQFCELTGLYWAWKNLDADYVGLAHYRRHFRGKKKTKDPFDCVLTSKEAEELLKDNDILVTKRRNYYIETIYDHYVHTLYPEPLDETRKIIEEKCPEYLPAFDKHMKEKTMHAFNMFVMKKEYFDAYCEWLFDILFELTKRFEGTEYNSFHARYPGRISEVLLDVWMNENGYTYKEVPFVYMEKINMFKKGMGFLKAKFLHKKYGESF